MKKGTKKKTIKTVKAPKKVGQSVRVGGTVIKKINPKKK